MTAVQSSWSREPIRGIRLLDQQTFRVERGENAVVIPRYVIESRLTSLAEETSTPLGSMQRDGGSSYAWSFSAALGPIALPNQTARELSVDVDGTLKISTNLTFRLRNNTRVHGSGEDKPITELNEIARGSCHEKR